jgi:hypothetical protein
LPARILTFPARGLTIGARGVTISGAWVFGQHLRRNQPRFKIPKKYLTL